ncbi:hypothetical protein TorRG33x02_351740 [Trema orientale]|uniref:Secreted protein n=1 Tax=Trema orientale TaxID=63057 RepID=A0A2P5AFE3_TREOI|nr:hypothetical protein TorRG33x02_351740 [Trema orientale]
MSQRCGAVGLLAAQVLVAQALKGKGQRIGHVGLKGWRQMGDPILFPWVTHPPTKAMTQCIQSQSCHLPSFPNLEPDPVWHFLSTAF